MREMEIYLGLNIVHIFYSISSQRAHRFHKSFYYSLSVYLYSVISAFLRRTSLDSDSAECASNCIFNCDNELAKTLLNVKQTADKQTERRIYTARGEFSPFGDGRITLGNWSSSNFLASIDFGAVKVAPVER